MNVFYRERKQGFTLIELSIVLVIIGLIVGGVLVGRDLISAAAVRSQVSQIEKYQTAVSAFRDKYGELPGDIEPRLVTQFSFTVVPVRAGGTPGRGNGDGLIHGYSYPFTAPYGWGMGGEDAFFWADLSANSQLIEGGFNTVTDASIAIANNAGFAAYLPQAKIGGNNYVAVFVANGSNYFQIINPYQVLSDSEFDANPGLTVSQAYNIDKKTDDGIPASGNVLATMSVSTTSNGYGNTGSSGLQGGFQPASLFSAANASSATCYDTTSGAYSVNQNNGTGINCALSFKFQ